MAKSESFNVFRKCFIYGVVFGITATLVVWFLNKFFQ